MRSPMRNAVNFSDLLGKTLTSVTGLERESGEAVFTDSDGVSYTMYHSQDCCETVQIEDVAGDVGDLIGAPILLAECVESTETPEGVTEPDWFDSSGTWTFYKLSTIKGSVTIRWFGSSNGYYSETVEFELA